MPSFNPDDKILILRLHRLGHVPPGLYAAQLLNDHGFKLLLLEYGYTKESEPRSESPFPRIRWENPWAKFLPGLRAPLIWFVTFIRLTLWIVREGNPRLIIAHGLQEQAMAWLLKIFIGVDYIVHVHEIYESKGIGLVNRIFLAVEGHALRAAKFLIFPEKGRKEIYEKRYGLHNPNHLVFNCPPKRTVSKNSSLKLKLGIPPEQKILLYMGGVGPDHALEEAILMLAHVPKLRFAIAGWGTSKYISNLKALAKKVGVDSRVHFLGQVEDKWEVLSGCDLAYCVYLPTNLRLQNVATASNKLTEALAAGLAIVCLDRPDFNALVKENELGVCLQSLEPEIMARCLVELIEDQNRLAHIAQKGPEMHQKSLHYEHQFQNVLEALAW